MNTLTGIEAERVNQILKHAIDRLQIMSYVPLDWDDDIMNGVSNSVIATSLEKQWMAEEQLRAIGELIGSSDAGGKDISIIKQCHRSTRNTCRNLQVDRDSLQLLMNRPEIHSDNFAKFIKYMNELRSQTLARMTTTVEDEAAHRTLLHDLTEKERHLQENRDALQKKLNEVCDEKEKVTFSLDHTLRKLQIEIQDITQHNAIEIDSVQKEMNDAISKATADHELRIRQLQDQVDGMERQISEVIERNKEEELRLRKDKTRSEITLSAKIAQYDEDMIARRSTRDELSTSYEVELKEYAALKEYFDQVDADIRRSQEEERIIAAVEMRADYGTYVLNVFVSNIQKIVRGHQARVVVTKLKAKKGGKGKGAKGKGKKGK